MSMGMYAQPAAAVDERQITRRIAAGDREALSELYVCYQRALFSYLLQLTLDYGLAGYTGGCLEKRASFRGQVKPANMADWHCAAAGA